MDGVEGPMSLPLDPHQWRLEAQKIFNISLARMQIEITEMARPRKIRPEDYLDNFFNQSLADPCPMIKINADGWRNISVVGFAGMLILALGLWLVTMETGDTIVLICLYQSSVEPLIESVLSCLRYVRRFAAEAFSLLTSGK